MKIRNLLIPAVLVLCCHAAAQHPSSLQKITIDPVAGFIEGSGGSQSFVVSGHYKDGSARDLTRVAEFTASEAGVAKSLGGGEFEGVAEGVTKVTAAFDGLTADAAVIVTPARPKTWDFTADIAPVFSKFGCNGSNCHGALTGQSGFKLSLFGYDPQADYEAVVHASGGRRLNLGSPEDSLLLQKPTFTVAHGGGQVLAKDSLEYSTLIEWIREGAPVGKQARAKLLSIRAAPTGLRVLQDKAHQQQLVVIGHYSDGSRVDLTRRVRYTSSDDSVVTVSPTGLVEPKRNGEATVLVRTLGQVDAVRFAVTMGRTPVELSARPRNSFIDELVYDKLSRLGIEPAPPSSDHQFLRRVYLDTIGTLPTAQETSRFLADNNPDKRDHLVDELLGRPEFAQFWALKWGDLFMIRAIYNMNNSPFAHAYFKRNFEQNRPYDQVAREMIAGIGPLAEVGPNNFFSRADRRPPEEYTTLLTKTFLGLSLECARCHDHPNEKWTRDDFLGIAAFFSQVNMKERNGYRPFEGFVTLDYAREFKHPESRQVVKPRLIGGAEPVIGPMVDRRQVLAEWVGSPDNPYFAKATVNRIWAEFMGRGLVHPVDDFRATNPPANPELMDRLAAYFVDNEFRLKPVMALILKSHAYQLSSATNDSNAEDEINYSRYYPRRLTAEQLLDAVSGVTGVPERFLGFYPGKPAIDLPDPGVPSYFLATFDRPVRDTAECERDSSATLTQALHFMNGETLQAKIGDTDGALRRLISQGKSDEEIIEFFYHTALNRPAKPEERVMAAEFMSRQSEREKGLQGVVWALLNTKEFLFNH